MHTFMGLSWRKLILGVWLMLLFALTISAQEHTPDGMFIFLRSFDNGTTEIVRVYDDNRLEVLFTIEATDCFAINDSLDLIAISPKDNPEFIRVYDISSGQQLQQIMWQSEWMSDCGFIWMDNSANLFMTTSINGSFWLGTEIDVLTGASQSADLYVDPIADSLPDLTPVGSWYIPSQTGDFVVYMQCTTSEIEFSTTSPTGEACRAQSRSVLYDLEREMPLELLQNSQTGDDRVWAQQLFFSSFSWSHSGRFLAYPNPREDSLTIYDTTLGDYINITAIDTSGYWLMQTFRENSLQWSPDETMIAFWLRNFQDDWRLAFYDRENDVFTIVPTPYPLNLDWWNIWGWLPDGQSIGVIFTNHVLVEIDMNGIQRQITDRVEQIYTYVGD